MKTPCQRLLSLLLVFVLVLSLIPSVYAADNDESTPTEPEATETTASTESPTTTPPQSDPSEETEGSSAGAPDSQPDNEYGIATTASTSAGVLLFDYADHGNYTTVLNSQVSVTYKPNGTGSAKTAYIKNLGWHFARYNNIAYADDPLYCIEPYKNYAASTSGNSVDRDVTLTGSGSTAGATAWYSLPEARRKAIGLILLYSDEMWDHSISVTTTYKDDNPNVPLRIATQFLIYEIVCGLRDPETFVLNSANESGTAGNIFYNAGAASVSYFAPNYNTLVSCVQAALKIPSFTSSSSSSAPTITLTGDETSVYDSNGVLSGFSFTNGNGAEFRKSGNTLYISQTGTISESTVFKATKTIPSAENSAYSLWYMSGSSYQTTINLYRPESGTLNAYFKLKGQAIGNTGESLEGWEITIYSDKECTQKVTTVTTNADGKVGIYLDPGIYYARESGDTEGRFENEYWLVDESIKEFEILPHKDVDITFVNTQYGKIKVIKSMPSSGSLEGWTFIVRDINGDEIKGSPFITDASGLIVSENLYPGTYAVEEVIPDDSPYICVSENPQSVTVVQGRTAEVRFTNSLRSGKIAIRKVDTTGEPLAGAEFLLEWSVDGTSWLPVVYSNSGYAKEGTCSSEGLTDGRLISDKTGLVEFTGLHPERLYRLTETAAPDGFQLLADTAYEGGLPDDKEYTVDLTVVNVRTYELPETGSKSLVLMPIALILACSLCGAILFVTKRKKQ